MRQTLSLTDAARTLNVSTRTIRRYIADGRLTGYRTGPRLIRVDPDDLDQLLRPIPSGARGTAA